MKKYLLSALLLPLLGGCASIVNGTQQSISVTTPPAAGAHCKLSNDKGVWYIPNTPGSVIVHRSYRDLDVSCAKPGYGASDKLVQSHTKGMAFGNVLFGGVIGAGVDVANGSAYDYPQQVIVPLRGGERG
jgi:hypothetical protein